MLTQFPGGSQILRIDTIALFLISATASALLTGFAIEGVAHATIYQDKACWWGHQSLSGHPCACFDVNIEDQDMCWRATPEGSYPDNDVNSAMTTECSDEQTKECYGNLQNSAFSCGDVFLCKIREVNGGRDASGDFGSDTLCNKDDFDPAEYYRDCNETTKGSCNKAFGNCSNPEFMYGP